MVSSQHSQGDTGHSAASTTSAKKMKPFKNPYDLYYETPVKYWPLWSRVFYFILGFCGFVLTKIYFRWKVEDAHEYIKQQQAGKLGTVLACNHTSAIEPVLLVLFAWSQGLSLRPLYRDTLSSCAPLKWFFCHAGCIPIEQHAANVKRMRQVQRLLKRGESVLIFPEGTRVRVHDTREITFHKGAVILARMGRTSIYPCTVVGALNVSNNRLKIPVPHRIFFKIGTAIPVDRFKDSIHKEEATEEINEKCKTQIFELRDALRKEHPGCL